MLKAILSASYLTLFLKSITSGCFSAHVVYMLAGMRTFFFFDACIFESNNNNSSDTNRITKRYLLEGEEEVFVAQFENYENFKQKILSFFRTIDGWMVGWCIIILFIVVFWLRYPEKIFNISCELDGVQKVSNEISFSSFS